MSYPTSSGVGARQGQWRSGSAFASHARGREFKPSLVHFKSRYVESPFIQIPISLLSTGVPKRATSFDPNKYSLLVLFFGALTLKNRSILGVHGRRLGSRGAVRRGHARYAAHLHSCILSQRTTLHPADCMQSFCIPVLRVSMLGSGRGVRRCDTRKMHVYASLAQYPNCTAVANQDAKARITLLVLVGVALWRWRGMHHVSLVQSCMCAPWLRGGPLHRPCLHPQQRHRNRH